MAACAQCERLRRDRDRMELAHRMALNTIRDNPTGDNRQVMLLRAMAHEAKIDLDAANATLRRHQDGHTTANPA
jgi:hypothetical protein